MKLKLLIAFLFLIHIGLALFRLDHTPMWDDEASVAWFAKNYNQYGKIVAYDGTHIFSYRNGQLIGNDLSYNNPPLDIYYAAWVIRHFGDTDLNLRMAFALLGIIAMGLYLVCLWVLSGKDKIWFAYTSIILLLSVNYLLIESNARYYSLNFLFASLSLLCTLLIVQKPGASLQRKAGLLFLQVCSLYLLFLSHYLAAACWWLMCLFILFRHGEFTFSPKHHLTLIGFFLHSALLAACTYYFLSHKAMDRPDMQNEDSLVTKYSKLLEWFFTNLNTANIIPLWTVPVLILLFLFKRHLLSGSFRRMCALSLVFLLAMFLLNPQSTSRSTEFDTRYLYVIIPVLYAWTGYLLKLVHEKTKGGKVLAVILTLIFVNTTLLSAIPATTLPHALLPNYIKEKVQPFPTAYSEAIAYINTHFDGRKKILTLPGYHNTVFFRYLPDKIEITNTLDEYSPLSRRTVDSINMRCLYIGRCKPDYILQFGITETLKNYPYKPSDYRYIDTIPIYAFGTDITRPELYWHSFGPKKVTDTSVEALYIYHD